MTEIPHSSNLQDTDLTEQVGAMELLALNPDNEATWIEVIHKMDDVYADLVRYQVELEDKNAALEVAQKFISSVLSSMTDILIVCDINGRIQQVNAALEELVGKSEQELKNKPFSMLFSHESQHMIGQFSEKIRSDTIVDCEVSLLARDGSPMPIATNCASRFDSNGRLVGMVLMGRPVGELRRAYENLSRAHVELKQTQQQLIQSEKMASLGRLVAGVAHELNNPISFVFGNVHALKRYESRLVNYIAKLEEKLDPSELTELRSDLKIDRILDDISPLIEGTLEGAERVSDIVQELRRFSYQQKDAASPFDLCGVIKTASHWVVKSARVKPVVNYALPETLEILSNKGYVHQILVNLVQNATDVMENQANPVIEISCDGIGDTIKIQIKDQGPGIPSDDLIKIFDPFYTTKAVGKGTGLGLYISYNLAKEVGGDLLVDNHPDGGAVFTLVLPMKAEQHAAK